MPIFVTESEVIYSLKAANQEKNEIISSLLDDIIELERERAILMRRWEWLIEWSAKERGILIQYKH